MRAAVLIFLMGCSSAPNHPSWAAALERSERYELLDPDCRDIHVVYRGLNDEEATSHGMPSWACGMTTGRTVYVRESCTPSIPESWILEHEFLHVIITCSEGGVSHDNMNHIGPEWDGLRAYE